MSEGLFNSIAQFFGGEKQNFLQNANAFYPIYVLSDIWQGIGWNSIIYLAALSGIDQEQFEAARIDGARPFRKDDSYHTAGDYAHHYDSVHPSYGKHPECRT